MESLVNRTALLIGATGGIGPFIAKVMAQEKIDLVLVGLPGTEADYMATLEQRCGIQTMAAYLDICQKSELEGLVSHVTREFGGIDILVNNAGLETLLAYHNLSLETIERVIQIDLIAPILLSRLVLPGMLNRRYGHIVNMSSLSAKAGPPCLEPYAASKAGLIAFTESLRAEFQGTGVSASLICPGFVAAGMHERLTKETGVALPLLSRISSPEAVAQAVVRAIRYDIPEIIVNPGPTRCLTAIAELSPACGEWLLRSLGIVDWFKRVAERRQKT
jgi:short-subunit dehydrogenase